MKKRPTILIVDDSPDSREALRCAFPPEEYVVATAEGPSGALGFAEESVSLVLSRLHVDGESGMDLLRVWKERQPSTPFVLVADHGDIETAIQAMKLGASDYLVTPVIPDELLLLVQRCLEVRRKDETIVELSQRLDGRFAFDRIIGRSKPMLDVFARVKRAAVAESTILILGESGTGKELIAEAIHQQSKRKHGPFVPVNMAAVPPGLVESELFGHAKGSFTGATAPRVGKFEAANNGTIFIDEIGDFAVESQAKLLRVLEAHTLSPVGSNDEIDIDVRVVAATSRNLEELVAGGEFREDLFYRLSVVTVALPPLRERLDDIPLLVRRFLDELSRANSRPPISPDPELMRFLERYDWPGNVRQLHNCLESMVVMAKGPLITIDDLPAPLANEQHQARNALNLPVGMTLRSLERQAIEQTLNRFDGNRTKTAESLGISTRTLQRKLKAWGMNAS